MALNFVEIEPGHYVNLYQIRRIRKMRIDELGAHNLKGPLWKLFLSHEHENFVILTKDAFDKLDAKLHLTPKPTSAKTPAPTSST